MGNAIGQPARRDSTSPALPAAAVAALRRETAVLAEVRAILEAAEAAIAGPAAAPVCRACGACCDFAAAGHVLFLTTAELALLTARPPARAPKPGRCAYQVEALCTARDARPLGCRMHFCDPAAGERCRRLYEAHHRRLGELHRRRGIPYAYVELTAALAELLAGWGRPTA